MPDETIRLTREELYALVWAQPLRKLAGEYGLSNADLAKLCDRFDVPRPAPGHWIKLAHGQQPPQLPLPPSSAKTKGDVVLTKAAQSPPKPRAMAPQVPVRTGQKPAHPAITALRRALAECTPNQEGMLLLRGNWGPAIRVSSSARDRALAVLDALSQALVARGHNVHFDPAANGIRPYKLEARIAGEVVGLALTEHTPQRPHVLTAEERESEKRHGRSWAPKYDLVASGQLTLQLHAPYRAVTAA